MSKTLVFSVLFVACSPFACQAQKLKHVDAKAIKSVLPEFTNIRYSRNKYSV